MGEKIFLYRLTSPFETSHFALIRELLEDGGSKSAGIFEVEFSSARNDDVIVVASEAILQMSETFAEGALDAIPLDRIAFCFNRDAEAKMSERIRNSKDRTFFQTQYIAALEEPLVLPGVVKSIFRAERKVTFQQL